MDEEKQVNSLYLKILKRNADPGGLKTYTALLNQHKETKGKRGLSLKHIELVLLDSDEHKSKQPADAKVNNQKPADAKANNQKPSDTKPTLNTYFTQNNSISKVNVFMCVRDNSKTLKSTLDKLSKMKSKYEKHFEFYYWILENDSKDNSSDIITDFFRHNNGRYSTGNISTKKWGSVRSVDRVMDMAKYRNMNKLMCYLGPMNKNAKFGSESTDLEKWYKGAKISIENWKPFDGNFTIILDTQIEFEIEIFEHMVNILTNSPKVSMVTPYGCVSTSKTQYYDTYALKTLDNSQKAPSDWYKISDVTQHFKVNSAFSGFVVVRSKVLEKCSWSVIDANCSEHNAFCAQVSNFGDVVVAPGLKVTWTC